MLIGGCLVDVTKRAAVCCCVFADSVKNQQLRLRRAFWLLMKPSINEGASLDMYSTPRDISQLNGTTSVIVHP